MKRLLALAAAIALAGCAAVTHRNENPYEKPQFYSKYLNPADPADAKIQAALEGLRSNPDSATLHNELGTLLLQKGFQKDARHEFERSVNADGHFYPAWYNLGLIRTAQGDFMQARHAFHRTIKYKPGHSDALFQMGLMEEQRGDREDAIAYYVKALRINRNLLDVRQNPRVLDSKLIALALIEAYPQDHARLSMQFQGAPPDYQEPVRQETKAPSPQAPAQDIVAPAPPVTDPGTQVPPTTT